MSKWREMFGGNDEKGGEPRHGASREDGPALEALVRDLFANFLNALVDDPDGVKVDVLRSQKMIVVTINSSQPNTGVVIGRKGSMADAFRTLFRGICARNGYNFVLEISDGEGRSRMVRDRLDTVEDLES